MTTFAALLFAFINPFQCILTYLMGEVTITDFAANSGVHIITEPCNLIPGALHIDSFLGYSTTFFAYFLLFPAAYSISKV